MNTPIHTKIADLTNIEALVALHVELRDSLNRSTPTFDDFRCTLQSLLETQEISSNMLYARLGFTCERARWNGGRQIRYDLHL